MKFAARLFLIAALPGLLSLPARAETIDVFDNHGGSVVQYNARWAEYAQRGVSVRVVGPCKSACTILIGHIPRNRICVTPKATFGFHLAKLAHATAMIWNSYPEDIKGWINARGGLQRDFQWMRAPDTYRHFKRC
jgi:hypothetical protein